MSKQVSLAKRSIPALAKYKERPKSNFLSSLLISLCVYLISLILISLAFCIFLYGKDDPLSLIFIMSMVSLAISSFLGGFFLCRRCDKSPLVCGLIFIGVTLLISLLLSLVAKSSPDISKAMLSKLPSIIASFLGSFLGRIKPKRQSRRYSR